MLEWLFGNKKEEEKIDKLESQVSESFKHVKKDMENISGWLEHLDDKDSKQDSEISGLEEQLEEIRDEIEGIKNTISMIDEGLFKQPVQKTNSAFNERTAVQGVQTAVQTAVQTPETSDLSGFSVMERALIFVLLNTDMKLSYDDLAAMLGKSRTTVRGQVNGIRRKSEGLIKEKIEKNGKKRMYIPEETKQKLLKNVKVRVKQKDKGKKKKKSEKKEAK